MDVVEGDSNQSQARTSWQQASLDPRAKALLERDARTFLHQSLSTPCLNAISSARGDRLIDTRGRELLDFHGNGLNQVGHAHPRVVEAVVEQARRLAVCPRRFTNEPAVALAERLQALSPGGDGKVLLAPGGSEAVSIALKLARLATGRYKTLSMYDAFHGATMDAISVGGQAMFRHGLGPLLPGTIRVPPPEPAGCPRRCGRCEGGCVDYLEYVFDHEHEIGAVVAEAVRCTTVAHPPASYWRRVRELCDRHGALLIFDEIPLWLGRTGRMFSYEHFGVEPDMVVIGKGLGGGVMPMAAVLARSGLDVGASVALGHFTHEKSPVGAAAALATLDVAEDEGLIEASQSNGRWFADRLRSTLGDSPWVGEVRGLGLLLAVEIVDAPGAPVGSAARLADAMLYASLSRGLSFKVSAGRFLTLTPALTTSRETLGHVANILADALRASIEGGETPGQASAD